MAAISITAANVRPLRGAVIRRFAAASTSVAVGKAVYIKSDGTIELADATDTLAEARARGFVVAIGTAGKTTAAAGDMCDVVMYGAVELGTGSNTEGAPVYNSTTAGAIDQTAPATGGNYPWVIGFMEADSRLFVAPQAVEPTVVP